jgi:hypothetical protein
LRRRVECRAVVAVLLTVRDLETVCLDTLTALAPTETL